MPSLVDLCNVALGRVGIDPIVDLSSTVWGRRCNTIWPTVRDEMLRLDDWSFAITRANLPASTEKPANVFNWRYPLPNDLVRLLAIQPCGDWSIEGNAILTNKTAPLSIMYVHIVENPNEYPPDFFSAAAFRLAIELSSFATTTVSDFTTLDNRFQQTLVQAMDNNAKELPSVALPADDWLLSRQGLAQDNIYGLDYYPEPTGNND